MEYKFDVKLIKQQVADVIRESQGGYKFDLKVDKIIEDWLKAKEYFIEKMDGNLIYEYPEKISFELDRKSKINRICHFADTVLARFANNKLYDFLTSLEVEDFYNNKTSREYEFNALNSREEDITVPINFKIIKAFKFFEKNDTILKTLQNEASLLIQENCVSGTLCISVHPLDFLSASENIHNWRSCHALDGEYRSGNLNYLMDSATVICYLKADKQAILPHFPENVIWNSKKWRMWLFFSNDKSMMFAGRQYPFMTDTALEYTRKLLTIAGLGKWGDFSVNKFCRLKDSRSNIEFFLERMVPVGSTLRPLKSLVKDAPSTYMFNDILKSSCYDALYSYKKDNGYSSWNPFRVDDGTGYTNDKTQFLIGGKCICPICGERNIAFSDVIACESCADSYDLTIDDYGVCDICGTSLYYENMYELEDSEVSLCPNCYENETIVCQECGKHELPGVIKYYNGRYLCQSCIEDFDFTERLKNACETGKAEVKILHWEEVDVIGEGSSS